MNKKPSHKRKKSGVDDAPTKCPLPVPEWFHVERMRLLSEVEDAKILSEMKDKSVVYWMQRDMRVNDNWAMLYAKYLAETYDVPFRVMYSLDSKNGAQCRTWRHADFLMGGLRCIHRRLDSLNIPLDVLMLCESELDDPVEQYCVDHGVAIVVTDFSPLREFTARTERFVRSAQQKFEHCFVVQVDAHNVIPCWYASDKREVGARTLRPKINKLLPEFMVEFPTIDGQKKKFYIARKSNDELKYFDIKRDVDVSQEFDLDRNVKPVAWAKPGEREALEKFEAWLESGNYKLFSEKRNDPTLPNVISNLSPWINYGHVSFQRLALTVRAISKYPDSKASYLEEGIVRRELSDNFVFYTLDVYDSLDAAAGWARESLELHSADPREFIYTKDQFIAAETHDDLWNAAQLQLVEEGKMHGFLRMYWAKKILEWTASPNEALSIAQYLNDHFALDGNDPNGYVGVNWSIMGIHDMGWKERNIFGKIRFMNYAGCKRKFKVADFVARYPKAALNAARAGGSDLVIVSSSSKKTKRTPTGSIKQVAVVKRRKK